MQLRNRRFTARATTSCARSFTNITLSLSLALAGCSGADGTSESDAETTAATLESSSGDASSGDASSSGATSGTTEDVASTGAGPTSAGPTSDASAGTTDPWATTGMTDTEDPTGTTGGPDVPPCPYVPVDGEPAWGLEEVATGFEPYVVLALGDPTIPDRLFVVERAGNIKILEPGATQAPADAFLHVDVSLDVEMGLLGLAFHPQFHDNGLVYINYNPPSADRTVIAEYAVDPDDPAHADLASERVILEVDQPYTNHNGGMLAFGGDGYLYVGMGNGGEYGASQDPGTLLGKMLRIDVTPGDMGEYSIPPDNPFVDDPAYHPAIWATGLRNPWRWSIDPETGFLYAGDVGEAGWEEINVVEAGRNYGFPLMEGNECLEDPQCDAGGGPNEVNADGLSNPLVQIPNPPNLSVIGGYVYRSCEVPAWTGTYLYADWISQNVWGLRWDGQSLSDEGLLMQFVSPVGFGSNAWGDVYVVGTGWGAILRVAPA